MNRPQHVWGLFVVCLAFAAGGLGWLTHQTLELDRTQVLARRQSEQDERIGLALWRMDAFLMPLLVQEASRPDFVYSANFMVATLKGGKESPQRTLSPVLDAPPPFVRLHFQIAADGRATSPQAPTGDERQWSLKQGVPAERLDGFQTQLSELSRRVSYQDLLAQLPELAPTVLTAAENPAVDFNNAGPQQVVVQSFAQQQFEQLSVGNGNGNSDNRPANTQAAANNPNFANVGNAPNYGKYPSPATAQQAVADPLANGGTANQYLADNSFNSTNARSQTQQRNVANDLSSRNSVFQAYASRVSSENRQQLVNTLVVAPLALEGMSRPLWVGNELVLARRVERGGATYVQGCWLDWPALEERLRQEVADVLPNVECRPAEVGDVARSLATLPVRLVAPAVDDTVTEWSPIHLALTLAWCGLALAAIAAAVTLASVMALSERRASFVAAVTHELRTPLTTFRMYAEMLSGGMIPPEKQPTYLDTLQAEAERLSHLVDNVLQYARLERGRQRPRREASEVAALVDRLSPRLKTRTDQVGLAWDVSVAPNAATATLTTDAGALEQILFNLVDNACKYAVAGTDPRLHLEVTLTDRRIVWRVRDHGPGISADGRRRLFRPFSKTVQEAAVTAPGVGLGLALSRRLARELGGELSLEQSDSSGSVFALHLPVGTA